MKISVVTNAFNQAQFLREAAESVLAQCGPEVEYFILDPGSTDDTPALLKALSAEYPGRFIVVDTPDDGPADGLNRAFERATGDWFYYLNADDYLLPGAFADAAAAILQHPQAGAIVGDGFIVDGEGAPVRRLRSRKVTARRITRGVGMALQQSTFYRADAFRAVGGFNTANRTCWDGEILFDLSRAGFDIAMVPGWWSAFRIHGASITGSSRLHQQYLQDDERMFTVYHGHSRTPLDRVRRQLAVVVDAAVNPARTLQKIADRLRPARLYDRSRPARP